MDTIYQEIIKEICNELNIKCVFLSKGWITMLEKDGITKFLNGYKFDLNAHGLGMVLDDKYATYEVLKEKEIPVIEHSIVYDFNNQNDYAARCNNKEYLESLFDKYDKDIVLKINNGTGGMNVFHITEINDLTNQFNKLAYKYDSLSISPYKKIINEYRVIVLNNEIKLMYKKVKPIICGNGYSTIKELLLNFNENYFFNYNNEIGNKVLEENEIYEYDWRFNLSQGSMASHNIPDDIKEIITNIALKTSKTIDLKFGSIDIINTNDNKYYVLEINSGVMMRNYIMQHDNGYYTAKKIYKEAIIYMFKD